MPETRPDPVKDLYERWSETFAERGELPLDEWRATIEEWAQATAEPGGIDYAEADAGDSAGGGLVVTTMLLNREFALRLAGMFLGDTGNPDDPLVSPLHADLTGLPPLYIQASRDEVLVDDSPSFAQRAKQAGVEVRLDLVPGQQHTFQIAAGRSPEADDAVRRLAECARPKLGL
jgi:dienelactone hydrolase